MNLGVRTVKIYSFRDDFSSDFTKKQTDLVISNDMIRTQNLRNDSSSCHLSLSNKLITSVFLMQKTYYHSFKFFLPLHSNYI
jgi:hypothetical protein